MNGRHARTQRAIAGRVLAGLVAAVTLAVACTSWEIPSKRCRASAFTLEDAAVATSLDAPCAACMNDQCCDAVGHCGETEGCNEQLTAARSCVLAAGTSARTKEEGCRAPLEGAPQARDTYACMRSHCGSNCAIPSCDIDPAAVAVVNGACDRCVTTSCCGPVNSCYARRGCKLVLECIFGRCGGDVGAALLRDQKSGFSAGNPCAYASADAGVIAGFPGCIGTCMAEFGREGDTFDSACRAFDVLRCASQARCGEACVVADAGADAGD